MLWQAHAMPLSSPPETDPPLEDALTIITLASLATPSRREEEQSLKSVLLFPFYYYIFLSSQIDFLKFIYYLRNQEYHCKCV